MILAYFYLIVSMLVIQFGATAAKKIFPLYGVEFVSFLRVSLSFFCMLVISWMFNYQKLKIFITEELTLKSRSFIFLMCYGISLGLMNLIFYLSIEKIPLGVAVTLEFIGPLGIAFIYLKKRSDIFWVMLPLLAMMLLFKDSFLGLSSQSHLWGLILAALAGFFWGLYIYFGRKIQPLIQNHSALVVMSVGLVFTVISVLIGNLILDPFFIEKLKNLSFETFIVGLKIAILSSAIPYWCELKALKYIPENVFGVLMSFEPVVATLMGVLFLNEVIDLWQCLAVFLVVGSCYKMARSKN